MIPRLQRLSRVEWTFFGVFALWMLIGLITTPLQIRIQDIDTWGLYDEADSWLRRFILFNLANGDVLLIALATVNTHLILMRSWGMGAARRWASLIVGIAAVVEITGVQTGFPFGAYHYTSWLGPRLGGILPLAIPFAWYVVVSNALLLVRQLPLYLTSWREAAAAGLVAMIYDWVMEPFAWRIRAYWIWEGPSVPWQNYAAWFFLTLGLVRLLAPRTEAMRDGWEFRPALMLGSFLLLFSVTRLVHGV